MRTVMTTLIAATLLALFAAPLRGHCEIPCGIYNDQLRVEMIAEDITTIEKSMKSITELSAAADKNYNQLVRWIMNKEDHADRIQNVVYQYFMNQRIKPADPSDPAAWKTYVRQLTLLHNMLVTAMKCKQSTDLEHVNRLRSLLKEFQAAYFGPEAKAHLEEHHH